MTCAKDNGFDSAIIRLDSNFDIVFMDEAAATLVGMPADRSLGMNVGQVLELGNLWHLMNSGMSFTGQLVVAGDRRILCDYLPSWEEDSVAGGVISLLRVLPQRAQESTEALMALLRSTTDFMNCDHDGVVVVDREGTVVMVNHAFAKVLDTTPHAMIGKHVYQAYPNSQPSHLPAVMETGKPEIGITHYLNGKQVYASLYPLVREGRIIGGIGKILFKDIREIALIAKRLQAAAPQARSQRDGVTPREALFNYDIHSIVGRSPKMTDLKEALIRVASKTSSVLLRGESGTGKELFAHAIHAASNRRYEPFVKVNCAAIPEHLLESELFGYADGAFTGARKGGQIGKFEQADNGTIFLDEIGDMPLYMQAKMLRVLQEKEMTQLGSHIPKTVDVRVVAATNCDLEQLVKDGKFRSDLYYRLNVVALVIPSLRERKDDLAAITDGFIKKFNAEFGLDVQGFDPEAWDIIERYDWPGNVRELRNVIESAFNEVSGPMIQRSHLPEQLLRLFPQPADAAAVVAAQALKGFIRAHLGRQGIAEIVAEFEKVLVHEAIELSGGNKLHAAQLLRISRQGLYKKLGKPEGADPS